jgi:hypothetical protein
MKQEVGSLMYLYLDNLQLDKPIEVPEFIISGAAKAVNEADNRNWLPVIVTQTGQDEYRIIGNAFAYAVAEAAGLEKVWCIVADSSEATIQASKLLAQEELPKVNLATATLEEIKQGLDYLTNRPVNRLMRVKPEVASHRINEAPRRYWRENLMDVTKLKGGITKGKQLNIFKEVFYVTPEPLPDVITDPNILEMFNVTELKKIAKKRGIKGYSKHKRNQLIKTLSESR